MDVLVCVKSVPETAEAELEVATGGEAIETDDLVFGPNEWDLYALEEAVRLKEAHGGTVTALTLGDEQAEDGLRRALAMGADEAIHLTGEAFEGSDAATVAEALARAVRGRRFDLVLAGAQSSDLGQGQTGVLLASRLGLPHATLAVAIEVRGDRLLVTRELEASTLERVELPLPALVTVQSGINRPRYVSIMGIRKVRSKTVDRREAGELGMDEAEVGREASSVLRRALSRQEAAGRAELLEGPLPEVCRRAAALLREKAGAR